MASTESSPPSLPKNREIVGGPMTRAELAEAMHRLRLSPDELAYEMDVSRKTVSRWISDPVKNMRGMAVQALRAWVRSERYGIAWRKNSVSLLGLEVA